MKFCNICGDEIWTKDGENTCRSCEDAQDAKNAKATLAKRRKARQAREGIMRDLGLVKVKGAMGGVYWE